MVLLLQHCIDNMKEEEHKLYQDNTATELFNYLYYSEEFQRILSKMIPNQAITEDEWTFMFEKLYLVTYKAMTEESPSKLLDSLIYLISSIGTKIYQKDSSKYNDYYKNYEIIRSIYRTKKVDDFLLKALAETMDTRKVPDFETLLEMHREASLMRNHRDFMYQETLKSNDGEITASERAAINSFNRSYEKEKRLVLKYKK